MVRVLVVDDHDLVRMGIARMLEDVPNIEVIGQMASGEEAVSFCRNAAPDVILMDIRMPGMGGLEATRKILRQRPKSRIIAVTVCDDGPLPSRLLQAGAVGYLTKGAALEEMIKAIKTVYSGRHYLSPEIAQNLALKPYEKRRTTSSPFDELSDREMQISMMIVACKKVQEISAKLCLSPKTVNTYRYRIFEKLGISSDVELTLLAIKYEVMDPDHRA